MAKITNPRSAPKAVSRPKSARPSKSALIGHAGPSSDPYYSFKILRDQPITIRYLLTRPPSSMGERVGRWLSNIRI